MPFLVDWWDQRLPYRNFDRREAGNIAHAERMFSPLLASVYNRPHSVINLQALHDRVYTLMGVK